MSLHKLIWHSAVPREYEYQEFVQRLPLELRQKSVLLPAVPLFAATSFGHHWLQGPRR